MTQMTMTVADALANWGGHDRDDPFGLYAAVRERGAVHPVTLADGHPAWLVVGYDEARAALKDPRLSKDMHAALAVDGPDGAVVAEGLPGPAFARHMLAVDQPDHTRLRRLVSSAFTPGTVERLRPRIQQIVDELLDELAGRLGGRPVDLVAGFAFPLPFTVICELLGVPEAERAALGRGLSTMLVPTDTPEAYARAKTASDAVVDQLRRMVRDKTDAPGDDLVSALIHAPERLTDQELLSTVFQLIVAGHDTTTTLIGNGVVALLRHPDQLESVRADPRRIPAMIEELLRYDAPVPHSTFRYAIEPIELGGHTIPAGAQVIVGLAAANRDPRRFSSPDRLDLGRAEGSNLAFGHGIHHCLGAPLARLEGELAFGSLLRRFPHLRLAVRPDDLHWGHGDGLVLRGLTELPVVLAV